ncbi:MFS transporter [Ruicaihuangia caeni]|uniref:MFS transporter n=1 Tax=Ruicaihuangia caeni TaxID=3042517 RepID=A0AAW6T3E1_9MICO|nr:MFS transporter [Klugiella sp. YN-L-19]MDI2097839.1 MFS transporter [Klugiella sp. YN-L-19]
MCIGSMISMFNTTLVNLLVPAIGGEFGVPAVGLEWVSAAYTLAYGALLMIGGAIGTAFGRRAAFLAGTAVFTAASVACALAPDLVVLLLGRALQGVGVALLLPQTLAILRAEFDDAAQRSRMVGLWAGVASLGLSAGPVLGGVILAAGSWRLGFVLSAALAIAAFILGARGVPPAAHGRPAAGVRVDWVGAAIGAVGLGGLVEGLLQLPLQGFASPLVLGAFAVGTASIALFLIRQRARSRHDRVVLIPPSLWQSPAVIAASVAGLAYFFMFFGTSYFYSIDLQEYRGHDPFTAGLLFLPMMLSTAAFGPIAGRLAARFGIAPVLITGLGLGAAGCALLAVQSEGSGPADLAWRLAVVGVASGLMSSSMSSLAVADADPADSSTAAALHNTFRQIGSTLGVAALGAIIGANVLARQPDAAIAQTMPGIGAAMAVTAAVLLAGMVTVFLLTTRNSNQSGASEA